MRPYSRERCGGRPEIPTSTGPCPAASCRCSARRKPRGNRTCARPRPRARASPPPLRSCRAGRRAVRSTARASASRPPPHWRAPRRAGRSTSARDRAQARADGEQRDGGSGQSPRRPSPHPPEQQYSAQRVGREDVAIPHEIRVSESDEQQPSHAPEPQRARCAAVGRVLGRVEQRPGAEQHREQAHHLQIEHHAGEQYAARLAPA